MPRMWKDKTDDELREEWHALLRRRSKYVAEHAEEYADLGEAMDALELEIGRRKKPLVDAKE